MGEQWGKKNALVASGKNAAGTVSRDGDVRWEKRKREGKKKKKVLYPYLHEGRERREKIQGEGKKSFGTRSALLSIRKRGEREVTEFPFLPEPR